MSKDTENIAKVRRDLILQKEEILQKKNQLQDEQLAFKAKTDQFNKDKEILAKSKADFEQKLRDS